MTETGFAMGRRFEGQIAVVTGAATGLGEGIAKRLAREGATVALFDRDTDALQQTVASFRNLKLKASGYAVDISVEIAVQSALEAVRNEVGSPKIMVNCAGIVGPTNTPILDYPADDYDRVYSVNLRGSFLMIKYALPHMLKEGYGRILLMASISGKDGNPFMCGYTSSKAGVIGLVKGVAKEYPKSGVTINALAPAVVMTDLVRNCAPEQVAYMTSKIPMERCGTIEEVASMSSWIVSPECSFSTGFVFDLSGGRATY
jgi:NAD(P)-dependent dehydrogenase (short-subunit alcohol dehydrogenase family)